jgi:RNA polymerase sigma-70 factor, ECF subfamily
VRNRSATEDLTSDVFHGALAGLPTFEWRGAPFGAWLLRISANAIIDWSKRADREQSFGDAASNHRRGDAASANFEPSGLSYLKDAERRARLFPLVEKLPENQRRVVTVRFAEEKRIAEIACDMGRTEGAIKQLQFRALEKLRARMEEHQC